MANTPEKPKSTSHDEKFARAKEMAEKIRAEKPPGDRKSIFAPEKKSEDEKKSRILEEFKTKQEAKRKYEHEWNELEKLMVEKLPAPQQDVGESNASAAKEVGQDTQPMHPGVPSPAETVDDRYTAVLMEIQRKVQQVHGKGPLPAYVQQAIDSFKDAYQESNKAGNESQKKYLYEDMQLFANGLGIGKKENGFHIELPLNENITKLEQEAQDVVTANIPDRPAEKEAGTNAGETISIEAEKLPEQPGEQKPRKPKEYVLEYEQALNMAKDTYPNGIPRGIKAKLTRLKNKHEIEKLQAFKEELFAQPIHFEETKTAQKKKESPIANDPEPVVEKQEIELNVERGQEIPLSEEIPAADLTPAERHAKAEESRGKLRNLIDRLTRGTKEGLSGRYERAKNYFEERSKHFDTRFAEIREKWATGEKWVTNIGEGYNKMPLTWKIASGAALTLGLGISLPLCTTGAMVFGSLMAGQRAAGMFGMYAHLEKSLRDSPPDMTSLANAPWYKKFVSRFTEGSPERQKNVAAAAAMVWTLGLGSAMTKIAQEIGENVPAMEKYLREHWPFGLDDSSSNQGPAATTSARPAAATPQSTPAQQFTGAQAQVRAVEQAMTIDVRAEGGKGYEWMLKRVWEEAQNRHLSPDKFPEGSDMYKLLHADKGSIDGIVHKIAMDPQHPYFNTSDATSVKILEGQHMTFDPVTGNVMIDESAQLPAQPEYTPPYPPQPEVHMDAPAPTVVEVDTSPLPNLPPTPPLENMHEAPTFAESASADTGTTTPEVSRNEPEIPMPPQGTVETSVSPTAEQIVTNEYGLRVPLNEAHVYADEDARHLLVYGGSVEERGRLITEFLTQNPDKVVYAADDAGKVRIPWHMLNGEIQPGAPIRTNGFLGFFSTFMNSPEPNEFQKIIK